MSPAPSIGAPNRPFPVHYHDADACSICGGEDHTARSCRSMEFLLCTQCLGSGEVLHCVGSAAVAMVCPGCEGKGRSQLHPIDTLDAAA